MEISPGQERYIFSGWEGVELDSPTGMTVVEGPMTIRAIYDNEYMLNVQSRYGSTGAGWYSPGETASIGVPQYPSSVLFLKMAFKGFAGYPGSGPFLSVKMDGPMTVTATYTTEIDVRVLSLAIISGMMAGMVYLVSQREYNRRRKIRW